jgi:hypothetical protein
MGDILCTGKSFVPIHILLLLSINHSGVNTSCSISHTGPICPVQRDAERIAVFGASTKTLGASVKTKILFAFSKC